MKIKIIFRSLSLLLFSILAGNALFAQSGINTDGSLPDNSAMLDVKSANKGVLVPRMTAAMRNGISSPATGLFVYQTDSPVGIYYFNGSIWKKLAKNYTETDPIYSAWNKRTGISIPASQVSDFATAVSNVPEEVLNTAKNTYPLTDQTKLGTIQAGAEVNVQRDWNATSGDAFVLNRMNTAGVTSPANPDSGDVIYYDGTNWLAKTMTVGNAGGAQPFSNIQPILTVNFCISLYGVFPSMSAGQPYVGEIEIFGFNWTPIGWESCSGQLLPISEFETLFMLIGTTYGGDGEQTFAVPDLRGRLPLHMGTQAGNTYQIGEIAGSENTTILSNQLPAHSHNIIYQ